MLLAARPLQNARIVARFEADLRRIGIDTLLSLLIVAVSAPGSAAAAAASRDRVKEAAAHPRTLVVRASLGSQARQDPIETYASAVSAVQRSEDGLGWTHRRNARGTRTGACGHQSVSGRCGEMRRLQFDVGSLRIVAMTVKDGTNMLVDPPLFVLVERVEGVLLVPL